MKVLKLLYTPMIQSRKSIEYLHTGLAHSVEAASNGGTNSAFSLCGVILATSQFQLLHEIWVQ